MKSTSSLFRLSACVALIAASTAAHASFVSYNSQSSFVGATANPGVDNFNNLADGLGAGILNRAAGVYTYTVGRAKFISARQLN